MVLPINKDIIIKDGDAKYHFSYLDWDSNFFTRPSYSLNTDLSHFCKSSNSIEDQIQSQFKDCFVTAKIDTSFDYEVVKKFQTAGFYYIETEIKLKYQKNQSYQKVKRSKQNIEVYKLSENRNLSYAEIGSTFQNTRFHTDLNISMEKADDLWVRYLKNYVPDDNHFLYAAKVDNKIAGVILANKDQNQISLFYVAVKANYQGMGIGTQLIHHVASQFNEYEIVTGTQAKNIQAINYYIKNNFSKIISTKTVLHRW